MTRSALVLSLRNLWNPAIKAVLAAASCWALAGAVNARANPVEDAFPEFDNVTYLAGGEISMQGAVRFRPCRVHDPDRQHYQTMDCGYLVVPENPAAPAGRQLTLFVGRLPAIAREAQPDPLLVIDGGPGSAASETFIMPGRGLEKIRQDREMYIVDQRGTGKSGRLDCDVDEEQMLEDELNLAKLTRQCLAQLDADPRFYTTTIAVNDLELVRRALAFEQWNIYGVSYGTRVAQEYLREFPGSIRTTVLDGVLPPQITLMPRIALESQRALEQLITRCANNRDCSTRFGGLEAGIASLFSALEKRPITVVVDPFVSAEDGTYTLGKDELTMLVRLSLYNSATLAILPLTLHEAYANNDFLPLARSAKKLLGKLENTFANAMHNSVMCSEDFVGFDPASLENLHLENTYIGADQVRDFMTLCELWPTGAVGPNFKEPVMSDVPVLLISGSVDPITPPEYAVLAAKNLTQSHQIVVEEFGHGVAAIGCMPRLMAQFVQRASAAGLDEQCLNVLKPDPFFIDFNGPSP
ncbi:alpha/beta fold hydrolase [Teredinibacter turnerae]|uniref:alpha/beta fold hydrolase n=1 Tax=Teredinibacter turnerae TaxID=2426 RepID=UPI0003737490|nr:alpha/beta fold hydrolase [Teredinibacter turnerae]